MTQRSDAALSERTCAMCGETKPAAAFSGNYSYCKVCKAAWLREYRRQQGAEERTRRWAEYRAKNEERIRETRTRSRARQDPEEAKAKRRARYAADPEKQRAARRAYYVANREKALETQKRSAAKRPEVNAAAVRRYREKHPEIRIVQNQNRRARTRGTKVTLAELDSLWTGECGICGSPIEASLKFPHPGSKSLDHIEPLSRGGAHAIENLQWAHLDCNIRKGANPA